MEVTEEERWISIDGFEGRYEVSSKSRVRIIDKNQILKTTTSYYGYKTVDLFIGKKYKRVFLHRLVAIAFISNKYNYPIVNHKNGVKSDNSISNLEWCNHKQNSKHAYNMGLIRFTKEARIKAAKTNSIRKGELNANSKIVLNKENGVFFYSIKEAAECINIKQKTLSAMLTGQNKNRTNLKLI